MTLREEMRVQEVAAGQPSTADSPARVVLILDAAPSAFCDVKAGSSGRPAGLAAGVVGGSGCRWQLGGFGTTVAHEG